MKSSQKLNQISTHFNGLRLSLSLSKIIKCSYLLAEEALGNDLKDFSEEESESPRAGLLFFASSCLDRKMDV